MHLQDYFDNGKVLRDVDVPGHESYKASWQVQHVVKANDFLVFIVKGLEFKSRGGLWQLQCKVLVRNHGISNVLLIPFPKKKILTLEEDQGDSRNRNV